MRCIRIDLSKIFPMEPSEFKNFLSVESYDEKTAENDRNCYLAENGIVLKLSKISILNFKGTNERLC